MSSPVFDKCNQVSNQIVEILTRDNNYQINKITKQGPATDLVFINPRYRRAHVSVVDAINTKNIWLLHVTIFPHVENGSPIYGFDIVAGPNKVSGAFHDFSPVSIQSPMLTWFKEQSQNLDWNKKRELPDWAKNIFSNDIVAIGAVGLDELEKFAALGIETLEYYLTNLTSFHTAADYSEEHNYYCRQQRRNPHTPRVLQSLGFTEEEARTFVDENLFPLTH